MIEMLDLKKKYGKVKALDGLTLSVGEGELFGFVGPNGAGKTTALRILAGVLFGDSGTCKIDGVDAAKESVKLKKLIGYVPDFFGVYENLKVMEYLYFFAASYGLVGREVKERCYALMEKVELTDKMDFYVDDLSRGMKQRLSIARTLIHDPKVLIFDEPASGLDMMARAELRKLLRNLHKQKKTIVLSTHILREITELCTGIAVIEGGKTVISGSVEEIERKMQSGNPVVMKVAAGEECAIRVLKEDPLVGNLIISEHSEFYITYEGNEEQEADLLGRLIASGASVSSFYRKGHDLESVFIKIME